MTHDDAGLARYYADRAREYESVYDKAERQADLERLRADIPRRLAGKDVLEIACGTGYWTQLIAPLARSVTAIDINEETLAIARSKPLGNAKVEFRAANVHELEGYTDFTAAFAGFWWSHMLRSQLRPFIASLHTALAPGAVVVVLDNLYVPGSSTPISHVDADGNQYQKRRLSDGSEHVVLKNFPTEEALRAVLAGYASAVEYTQYEYYWLLTYAVAKH